MYTVGRPHDEYEPADPRTRIGVASSISDREAWEPLIDTAPRQLSNSLDWPPHPGWEIEPGFSHAAEREINAGFRALARSGLAADVYSQAYGWAVRSVGRSISLRQRLRTYYLMGAALIGGGADDVGIDYLAAAMNIAQELYDPLADARIAHLAGAAESARDRCAPALQYQAHSLDGLRALEMNGEPVDAALELDVLNALASCNFILEHYQPAFGYLAQARRVAWYVPEHEQGAAQVEWNQALLLRWRGEPERALKHGMAAVAIYAQATSPTARMTLGRLNAVLSEIASDVADLPDTRVTRVDRAVYDDLACTYSRQALALAKEMGDSNGTQTARLAKTRLRQESQGKYGTRQMLDGMIAQAERREDMATLCQAQSALGRYLELRGEREEALNLYRKAWDTARRYEMPAMGAWARRALLMSEEFDVKRE